MSRDSEVKVVRVIRDHPEPEAPIRSFRVEVVDYNGPPTLLTHRDRQAEAPGTSTCAGSDRTIEDAIDAAVGQVNRHKKDVVVWLGSRVAAVVRADDLGRVQVTPFID